ncbi:MAG: Gfo/Idh/MocA family oxidoreductase [Verrucomicrobia bacterium]|nr:Gfo/Idh/MocA family oxidoreductase [Verrucomicrobiota bacterium]MBI3868137.1 Gfo/Idh/MocA family oxidoreductase [Verrucomicrobiota bacterium]
MNTSAPLSRRRFIQTSSAAAGAIGLSALQQTRAAGANDRIRIGVIGVGGMGTGHVHSLVGKSAKENIEVVAVSDVYQRRVNRAREVCKGEGYLDYRRLLDRKDIDAVLIATPDHWHGKISIETMESGKHVYCEKPMTHTVEQAIQVRNAVRRLGKVFQVGPNGTANDGYWKARDAIAAGRIGKVTWAHGSYNRNARTCLFNEHQKIDPTAGPDKTGDDHIDWNMWLGHEWGLAPKIAWNPEHFFRFRKYWPYNGGVATDLLYHKLAPLLIAIRGANGEYPIRVNANGGLYVEKDGRDIPDTFMLTADYPSEWSLFLVSTLTNDAGIPDRIYGKHGTMELGGEPSLRWNGDFKEEFKAKNDGKEEAKVPLESRRDLEGNWIDAMRGLASVHCNAELGCATMVAIKMAVESYRQRRTLLWNPKTEKVSHS